MNIQQPTNNDVEIPLVAAQFNHQHLGRSSTTAMPPGSRFSRVLCHGMRNQNCE